MDFKKVQNKVDKNFREHFGTTPFTERINDIRDEFFELMRWEAHGIQNLKEETGDLMASLLMLCNESKWDAEEMIFDTLKKIDGRAEQYKSLGRKINVAILGGAFNPIHKGHIQLAQFVLNTSGVFDEVWLMPAYNHMYNKDMVDAEKRLEMCEIAAQCDHRIKVFDYEIKNKLKGETYYFFKRLSEEKELTEKYRFSMIIGLDNANSFDSWVNYEELEKLARFVVVPRKGVERNLNSDWYLNKPHIFLNNETTIIDVSSTEIRDLLNKPIEIQISNGKIFKLLDNNVYDYIIKNKFYVQ